MNAVLKVLAHQRRLPIFILVTVSLISLTRVAQQSFNGVTVFKAPQSFESPFTAKSLRTIEPADVVSTRLKSPYKRRLFVRLPGASARLGNRMFAHAALLGLASETDLQASVSFADDKNILSSTFDLTTPVVIEARSAHLRTVKWSWRTAVYVPPPLNLTAGADDDDDVVLVGYFQSWRYFKNVDERVRAEFRFRKRIADAAGNVLRQLTEKYMESSTNLVLVGIHVRRSDMTLDYHMRRGYIVADKHYIRRAMNYIADRVMTDSNSTSTSLLFIVCTDDDNWARLNINTTSYPVVFASSPNRKAAVDLAVLASCDHVITTVGTFSWWAGYLHRPDGITVYYAGFPKPGTEIGNDFHAEDFFPPGWIGLL